MFNRLKFILLIFLYLLVGQSALAAAAVQTPEQSYDAVIAEAKKGGYRLIEIEIEVISKPKSDYLTDEYFALDLPVAPAIMVGEEIVTEGKDVDDHTVETAICIQLGLPEPALEKKAAIGRLFRK